MYAQYYAGNSIFSNDRFHSNARALSAAAAAGPQAAAASTTAAPAAAPPPQRRRRSSRPPSQQQQQPHQLDLDPKQAPPQRRRPRLSNGTRQQQRSTTAPAPAAAAAANLSAAQLLQFERDGFVVTRGLVPAAEASSVRAEAAAHADREQLAALRHRVRVLCPPGTAEPATPAEALRLIARRGSDPLGFLQFFHLHRDPLCPAVRELALGPEGRLARVAAQLLGVKRVRLYQDACFLKQPGWAPTNWHSDLRMTRLDTNAYVTAWVPLRAVAGGAADSGLEFAAGSHRDFAFAFWHDPTKYGDLGARGYQIKTLPAMAVGDVSWHHGWTLHAAGEQPAGTPPRMALAVSYFADGARLLDADAASVRRSLLHDEDDEGTQGWREALRGGALARHPLLPVAWGG